MLRSSDFSDNAKNVENFQTMLRSSDVSDNVKNDQTF
jgi:hypothetical protein